MQIGSFRWAAVVCAFCGAGLMAQSSSPVATVYPISLQQTMTTGMVGLTLNQTAWLNVLNLNSVPATANAPVNCNVELQFLDPKNNVLKQTLVMNFAPQTAASLDLNSNVLSITPTAVRAEVRGVVMVNPPTPAANPVAPGYCSVMVSLEIFDNLTGSTVALTTDTRMIGTGGIMPLAVMRHGDFVAPAK